MFEKQIRLYRHANDGHYNRFRPYISCHPDSKGSRTDATSRVPRHAGNVFTMASSTEIKMTYDQEIDTTFSLVNLYRVLTFRDPFLRSSLGY